MEPDQEVLKKIRKRILVKEGEYAQLIQRLYDTGMVELVCKKAKEMNGLFGVQEDEGEKKCLILAPWQANWHFSIPEYPKLPHSRLFMLLEKPERKGCM